MMPNRPKVVLDLRIRVNPAKHTALRAFLTRAIPFYEQPGGIRVRLFQDRADPALLIERVEYADAATYERDHRRVTDDPDMKRYLEEWRALLDEPPQVAVYDEVMLSAEGA